MDNYEGTLQDWTKAAELNLKPPQDAGAYFGRGNTRIGFKDYKGAIQDYTKAIELNLKPPQDADVYINRGNAKIGLKDYKGAIQDYGKAKKFNRNVSIPPDSIEAMIKDAEEKLKK